MAKQTFTTGQVLTAAQMTSLQQTAMLGGAASAKTASYTLVAADAGTAISMSNASATTITVNTALFAAGDTVQITNLGAGVCTITAGTATVDTASSLALAQYESGTLDFTSASAAIFIKGAGAAAGGGSQTLLSTTALSGASTTISGISQDYNDLMIRIYGVSNATADGEFRFRPNGSGNSSSFVGTGLNRTTVTVYTEADCILNSTTLGLLRTNSTNIWTIFIFNYNGANYRKTYNYMGAMNDSTVSFKYAVSSEGEIQLNTGISSLYFANSGGNFSSGTVEIYGVK